jgi:hypothetical protein
MPNDHVPHPSPDDRNREVMYIRLPLELLERVEAHRAAMQASAPHGVDVSRAAAVRNLLELALDTKGRAA